MELIVLINLILEIGRESSVFASFIFIFVILTISILLLRLVTKFTLSINRLKENISKIEQNEYY